MNRYADWALNVFCWDGILPFGVVAAPHIVSLLLPRRQGALEITFVLVPVTAFLLRYFNGRKRFLSGQMYLWQFALFFLAILALVVIDAMLIMLHLVKNEPKEAWLMWFAIYLAYLAMMAIAQFPARFQFANDRNPVDDSSTLFDA